MAAGRGMFSWPAATAVAVVCAVCLPIGEAWGSPAPAGRGLLDEFLTGRSAAAPQNPDRPPPLVHSDDELFQALVRARQLLEQKDYSGALELLQIMITRSDSGFVASSDGRRWISLWTLANELIARSDEQAVLYYRRLHEVQAQKLFEQALADGDSLSLKKVVSRYLHTEHGMLALEAVGRMHFDAGEFAQAVEVWEDCLDLQYPDSQRPALLARLAVANHLAGRNGEARRLVDLLAKDHADAEATLAGRQQNVSAFAAEMVRSLPVAPPPPAAPARDWPGLGGLGDGAAVMSESKVVLAPRWRVPEMPAVSGDDVGDTLIALKSLRRSLPGNRGSMSVRVVKGHAQAEYPRNVHIYNPGGVSRGSPIFLPPSVQPVVVGETVIVRQDDAVRAYNIITGMPLWEGRGQLEKDESSSARQYYGYTLPFDSGQYCLTCGGGYVYALSDCPPAQVGRYVNRSMPGPADMSCLVAYSIEEEGKIKWTRGRGQGESELIRNGRYLSAPTYLDQRLYVLVLYMESYHLACLSARTGELVWSTILAQIPAQAPHLRYMDLDSRGSPPAVNDGIVVAVTNSGVIAGLEADTGRPLWAHQYPSALNRMGAASYPVVQGRNNAATYPPNPVIISRGRAFCLPCDSDNMLSLDCRSGQLLLETSRQDQKDLSFIDHDRLLLSGEGIVVVDAQSGQVLAKHENKGILGRPAVSRRHVLASAEGKVYRMGLEGGYPLDGMELQSPQGLLGNLVSLDGKLLAANAAGICAYFDYEYVRHLLVDRLSSTKADEHRQILLQWGMLAFGAERFDEALEALLKCERLAGQVNDHDLSQRVMPHLYRTYVAMANRSDTNAGMLENFRKARAYAVSPSDKAHLNIRLAKYHERAGEYPRAVDVAQELAAEAGDLKVADVLIGPEGNDLTRLSSEDEQQEAREWAELFVKRLIEIHGQQVYAAWDAKAEQALVAGRDGRDAEALMRVAQQWPNSKWADDAQFYAAELLYGKSQSASGVQAESMLTQTRRLLWQVSRLQTSELRVSAVVGLAAICARRGWQLVASQTLDQVREMAPETSVKFADIQGKLGDLIKRIESGKIGPTPPSPDLRDQAIQALLAPVQKLWDIVDEKLVVLRDQDGQAVRAGQKLIALNGKRAILLDTASPKAPDEKDWSALVPLEVDPNRAFIVSGSNLVGSLSADGKSVLVAYRTALRRFELSSGRLTLDKKLADFGAPSPSQMSITPRELVVVDSSGTIVCVDLTSGELRWKAASGAGRGALLPPEIACGCVLVRDRTFRQMLLLSLDKGRVLKKFEASRGLEGALTREGFLVTMVDDELNVWEVGKLDKPLWWRRYGENSGASILCVRDQNILVQPSQEGEVKVLPMAGGGQSLAEFRLEAVGGEKPIAIDAMFDGQSIYVLSSSGIPGNVRRTNVNIRFMPCRNLALHRLSLDKDKPRWVYPLDVSGRYVTRPQLPAVAQKHLVATVREMQTQATARAIVLDKETGKAVQTIDLGGDSPKVNAAVRHRKLLQSGQAVITDGFLTVETGDGVAVYGTK
ncbi:MAG: outer membrane biogenesis protein BamB [Planctomycetes bacterium ADurb.Bin126]|nr:MAG: outer membrane biogenesis protein BamB [Planctomycetes bacterium ADurb.Bin126]HQL73455.1 PQQ-binding-like beta-propeller repeat protein [Phycisphaerae bacterium]